jgi:DNA polymerase-2
MEFSGEGFIVHAYHDAKRNRIHVLGRLADGRSFAAARLVPEPLVCVRETDERIAKETLASLKIAFVLEETQFVSFAGDRCVRLAAPNGQAMDRRILDRAVAALKKNHIPCFGAELKGATAFLVSNGIRGGIRISGECRPGRGADLVFPDAKIEAHNAARAPLTILSIDIETAEPAGTIRAVGLSFGARGKKALLFAGHWNADPPDDPAIEILPDEKALLVALSERIREFDPDIITGWNVIDFDFPRLAAAFSRHALPFDLGRSIEAGLFFPAEKEILDDAVAVKRSAAVFLPGRQVLDALRLVRTGWTTFESYTLDAVAREILGRGKTVTVSDSDKLAELDRLYAEDPLAFSLYCLNDADLVLEILEKREVIPHTIERAALTGAGIDKAWTSVASFERVYAEGLYARGVIEPDPDPKRRVSGAAGGTVLDPATGMFRNVAVFDFRSLYPSIMRTFNIDPFAYEQALLAGPALKNPIIAPNGARFDRLPGILPALIDEYFAERIAAIDRGDDAAAFVYKILMNSFYGVLGSEKCKYARTELAGAITSFGKMCLHFARDFFVHRGYRVLYGDTDSVFIEMKGDSSTIPAIAADMTQRLNDALATHILVEWDRESRIAIRFEKLYTRFFIPRLRSPAQESYHRDTGGGLERGVLMETDRGRSKGYAGLLTKDDGSSEVEIKGMEAVRSDYTPLAQRFQRELLELLFSENGTAGGERFLRDQLVRLYHGDFDAELVYRKKIRRDPESYTASTPPHIKVARSLGWKHRKGTVEYLITVNGPEAVSLLKSPIDYGWYASSQILPIARSAGQAAGFDADAIFRSVHADGQLEFEYKT